MAQTIFLFDLSIELLKILPWLHVALTGYPGMWFFVKKRGSSCSQFEKLEVQDQVTASL